MTKYSSIDIRLSSRERTELIILAAQRSEKITDIVKILMDRVVNRYSQSTEVKS